ncbi:MAG: B12-binding domain-containing radical SAM protein [Candidatus Thiodiazotropha taylori]|uniref:B12-binding domain-containing radical SAM protein n=1 Tax=Candidatus Thiodiazotropha taylori TaxID=2792791 RepID=A0A9E4P003_9GAMM|nr:B12-binding domain-containing radical SAM protein [Candidatus Thiodiazotropha taylori]MCG8028779.1 B12-binding domain-containing radical SAM protein [Candidatus Thiodiazotropha taylori]MCG8040432.1 B12-binding domain-containing radical SAM protein [Candidatus Thiodiazotropha taylori]MCG8105172.1 B12-binding domain-containing radical SAM protein [Candidatus Thiodiazotropha taylori]MCG8109154.1 B12-binding domain-containing radical SAM protein [Candidatus Thiodiazotropha taylori]
MLPPSASENHPKVALVALHAGYSHSSLALQSIAAYADDRGCEHRMQLFDALVNTSHQVLIERLVEYAPKILGFSTYLWNISASIRLTRLLKQLLPELRVVFGGPEAGARGVELLQRVAEIDYVIEGEGEAAFTQLMNGILLEKGDFKAVSGLVYREDDQIQQNPVQLMPVSEIPPIVSEGRFDSAKPLVYWETSRGCPFRCSFCSSATERLRAFPMERVEADLKVLEKLSNKTIKLLDRSFHLGEKRTSTLLQRFADTPEGLRFHLELNPDRISEQAMSVFSESLPGKFQFEIGLQTLNDQVLVNIDRRMDVAKSLENIRQLVEMRRHPVHLDLIVGLPGESVELCGRSLDQTFRLYPDHLQLGILKLLPGTPLQQQAHQLGYRWDTEPPYEVLSNPCMAFKPIAQFKRYAELLERLYNSGLLKTTLAGLVSQCFDGSVSRCFDQLLEDSGERIARDNLQPDALFGHLCNFVIPYLEETPGLQEWLLWDYCQFSLVNGKTPQWIAERLTLSEKVVVQGSRRRLPVIALTDVGVAMINQLTGNRYVAGRYALWPRQHKKGKPVEVFALN